MQPQSANTKPNWLIDPDLLIFSLALTFCFSIIQYVDDVFSWESNLID